MKGIRHPFLLAYPRCWISLQKDLPVYLNPCHSQGRMPVFDLTSFWTSSSLSGIVSPSGLEMTKLTDEIAQASSNKQRVCGLPSTVLSYYCNHVANTNQNLPAKYPTPCLLHMYATCAQPPAFGRARTDINFRQESTGIIMHWVARRDQNSRE